MIARAQRRVTFHAQATPDLGAVLRMRAAEGEPLRAEIDVRTDDGGWRHDPYTCNCGDTGRGPCVDCCRVFDAQHAQRAEAALARLLGPTEIDYAPRWRLFLAIPDDC